MILANMCSLHATQSNFPSNSERHCFIDFKIPSLQYWGSNPGTHTFKANALTLSYNPIHFKATHILLQTCSVFVLYWQLFIMLLVCEQLTQQMCSEKPGFSWYDGFCLPTQLPHWEDHCITTSCKKVRMFLNHHSDPAVLSIVINKE